MIYHIFANKSNIGDWLSAKGIQASLPGYPITELFCDAPFIMETIDRLKSLQPNDFVVIGGGGLFMDYFAPFWESFLDVSEQLSFGIWGVGYCDLTSEESLPPHDLIRDVVLQSRFCFVRDELTRHHLSELNLSPPVGCPSLLYLPDPTSNGRGLLHVDNYTTVGSAAFDKMHELGSKIASETDRAYRRTNNRIESGDEEQLRRCLQLYRDSDVILSSALHGCVIGVALQKKVVAVSGDRKIDSFMQSVGLRDWVCKNDKLGNLSELLENIDEQDSCRNRVLALRNANQEVAQRLRTLLDANPRIEIQ